MAWKRLLFPGLITVLILLPQFLQANGLHWADIGTGDAVHYLVILNSFLNDGDFDLGNNYQAVHRGELQAGKYWAGVKRLDHHTKLILDQGTPDWAAVFGCGSDLRFTDDGQGRVVPVAANPAIEVPAGTREYSTHQSFIAVLLAPFLVAFRGTPYLEPAAVFCSGIAIVIGALFFRMLAGSIITDQISINITTLAAFLATPVWAYGRTLFMESFLLMLILGAYALALSRQRGLLAGICLALALQLKPYAAALAFPLLADFAWRRQWKACLGLAAPLAFSVAGLLVSYRLMYGGFLRAPQTFTWGNPFAGMMGQLCSPRWGLLCLAPVAAVALVSWPRFLWRRPRVGLICLSGFATLFLVAAAWRCWNGVGYGPRLLIPVVPLFFVPLLEFRCWTLPLPRIARTTALLTLVVSLVINGAQVFHFTDSWHGNPVIELCCRARHPEWIPRAVWKHYNWPE